MLSVNANIIYTIINVLILYFVFRKFLFKRIDKVLVDRKNEIDNANKLAEQKTQDADAAKNEYAAKLQELDNQKDSIMSASKEQGYKEYSQIIENAKSEASAILDNAHKEAENEKRLHKKMYESELTDIVVSAASKLSASSHTREADMALYNKFIDEAGDNANESE